MQGGAYMFQSLSFCIGNKTLLINDKVLSLGELTTQFLNITAEDFSTMHNLVMEARNSERLYAHTKKLSDWFDTNELYIKLDKMMCKHPCLALLKGDDSILRETKQLTGQISLFEDDRFEPSAYDYKIQKQIEKYEHYLKNPEMYNEENIPLVPPEKTPALLICCGNIKSKWNHYKSYCHKYTQILRELKSFNNTIYNFIEYKLSHLKKLNAENYAMALYDFFTADNSIKLVANPIAGTGIFSPTDFIKMHQFTRETTPGSGIFAFYDYYETETLQTLLKADFYHALRNGYIIRRCLYCKKYFLLKKAYHTKYCDSPLPDNPNKTCANRGYSLYRINESKRSDPRAHAVNRCLDRIRKDYQRDIIEYDDMQKLYDEVDNLYHEHNMYGLSSYEEFDELLQSKNLYPMFNVVRKTRPVGRPKKDIAKEDSK